MFTKLPRYETLFGNENINCVMDVRYTYSKK